MQVNVVLKRNPHFFKEHSGPFLICCSCVIVLFIQTNHCLSHHYLCQDCYFSECPLSLFCKWQVAISPSRNDSKISLCLLNLPWKQKYMIISFSEILESLFLFSSYWSFNSTCFCTVVRGASFHHLCASDAYWADLNRRGTQ